MTVDLKAEEVIAWIHDHPEQIGIDIGFVDLTALHGEWIREMVFGDDDYTLMAHRAAFKSSCLSVAIALTMILKPNKNIIFIRKTDSDVSEMVCMVSKILGSEIFKDIAMVLYGCPLVITKFTQDSLSTNLWTSPMGAPQLLGIGLKSSITGKHCEIVITDDICFTKGTKIATPFGDKNIEDLKIGDYVITPCGYNKIVNTSTRTAHVVTSCGLTGTYNHPIYNKKEFDFDFLVGIDYNNTSRINIKELLKWRIAKLLYNGTEKNGEKQAESIISYAQILKTGLAKCCIEQYGKNTTGKFLKTVLFTIKTIMQIITILITLSVYHAANIKECICSNVLNITKRLLRKKHDPHYSNGKKQKQDRKCCENQVLNCKKSVLKRIGEKLIANNAVWSIQQILKGRQVFAESAGKEKRAKDIINEKRKEKVYNIEVENANVYYANKILVHNCNVSDRISKAERDRTKMQYMELQNIRNRGGRIISLGTKWHKDDVFTLMKNIHIYDCYSTGLISDIKIADLKQSMTASLFAANYELKIIADEDVIFSSPQTGGNVLKALNGEGHIDAAYGGADYTAFTVCKKHDGKYYVFGKLWNRHVDDCVGSIAMHAQELRIKRIICEDNGDRGYLAKELNRQGVRARTYHETQNKYIKITTYLRAAWKDVIFVEGTDEEYINQICDFNENVDHDDAPDSLASLIKKVYFKDDSEYTSVLGLI